MEDALIVHLDPWRDISGVFAVKAKRYGWRDGADLVPADRHSWAYRCAYPAHVRDGLDRRSHGLTGSDPGIPIPAGDRVTGPLPKVPRTLGWWWSYPRPRLARRRGPSSLA